MENTYDPLKQYLKTQGQDFSMANLQSLATSKGMAGYTGTDEQNRQLSSSITPTKTPTQTEQPQLAGYTPITSVTPDELTTVSQAYGDFVRDPNQYMASQGMSEQDFRNKEMARMQREIDATNAVYANKLVRAKELGQGRLGSSTAIQARRGMLGSDFGEAITRGTENVNQDIYNSIEAERALAESQIRLGVEQMAKKNFEEARAAKESGFKNYIEFLKGSEEKKQANAEQLANILVAQGIDPGNYSSLNADAIKSGTTADLVKKAYMLKRYESEQATKAAEEASKRKIQEALATKGIETIGEGQAGYQYDPVTGQYKLVASRAKTYAPSTTGGVTGGTGNPQVDGWVALIQKGEASITNVPATLRTAVANGLSQSPRFNEATLANLQIVEDVLKNPGAISGLIQTGSIPFTAGATTKNQYEQLKGLLALDSREKLKGSGAISDFESKTLERAASSIGRNQGEADFENNLRKIRGVFRTASGMTADVKVTNQLGQVDQGELTRDEINDALRQGFSVEYQ